MSIVMSVKMNLEDIILMHIRESPTPDDHLRVYIAEVCAANQDNPTVEEGDIAVALNALIQKGKIALELRRSDQKPYVAFRAL